MLASVFPSLFWVEVSHGTDSQKEKIFAADEAKGLLFSRVGYHRSPLAIGDRRNINHFDKFFEFFGIGQEDTQDCSVIS
jgi:hypothetical protein